MNTYMEQYRKLFITIGVLLAVFLLVVSLGKLKEYRYIGTGSAATNTITVSGEGKVERAPDTAKISFTVEQESKDMKTAQTTVSGKIDAITKALQSAGIEEQYIKTEGYNSYPQYDYTSQTRCANVSLPCTPSTPVIRGYQVSHNVTVSVKDLDKVEEVLGILGQNAVSNISGPNFGFEDDKEVAREARDMAIEDAKAEAEKLADALGVRLVRIVSFNENNGGAYPVSMYARDSAMSAKAEMAPAPSVPVGNQSVSTNVTLVYEIR